VKSPNQRRAAIAALLLVPTLGACGFSVQTDQVYQAATGVDDRSSTVEILNAQVVSGTPGTGTFIATLVNKDSKNADELTGVTGAGLTTKSEGVEIPAAGVANLAVPAETGDPVQVQISGDKVEAGNWVRLTFVFDSGQSTTVLVPVVGNTEDFRDVPLPSAAPSDAAAE